jgi:hypothetical protein
MVFIESKKCLFSEFMLHISMKFENFPTKQDLGLLFSPCLISSSCEIPVEFKDKCLEEVSHFAIAYKNDDFFILVRVKEGKEINESVLGRHLHEILYCLFWYAPYHLLYRFSFLLLRTQLFS